MKLRLLIYPLVLLFIIDFLWAQERQIKVVKRETNKANRFALVIGNSLYKQAPLTNPVNDAKDMADVLTKCGFKVTLKTNADLKVMEDAVRDFSNNPGQGGIGLFYFAGHGMQVDGINYLIPVDSDIRKESEVKYKSMSANFVLDQMDKAGNNMNIIILDACRDNPFARSFRSSSSGLAFIRDAPKGTLIVYATGPGKTAAEDKGRNGIFTKHLLKMIKESNVGVMRLLQRVRENVMQETQEQQIPWEVSSLVGDFYFDYKDTRLEKIKIEISKLESQLKIFEDNAKRVKTEKERRETARKAEELEAKLKAKKRQQEWLKKEQERRERLKHEEEALAQQEALRQKRRKEKLEKEKARLQQLQEKFSRELAEITKMESLMSRAEAEKEVAALEAKISKVKKQVGLEKNQAISQLKSEYMPLMDRIEKAVASPKDQFEKSDRFNARLKGLDEMSNTLFIKFESDLNETIKRFDEEERLRTKIYFDRIKALKYKKYPVEDLKVKLLEYNADDEIYNLQLNLPNRHTWKYFLSIDPEKASSLYRNKDLLKAEGCYATWDNYTSLCRISIIDPISGKIPVHYKYLTDDHVISIIKSRNFFESNMNKIGGDFRNDYYATRTTFPGKSSTVTTHNSLVIDWVTGLMWMYYCSSTQMAYEDAKKWIEKSNQRGYEGYKDWRLPTLEEAASILERPPKWEKKVISGYLNRKFSLTAYHDEIWTGDLCLSGSKEDWFWVVDFHYGRVEKHAKEYKCYVLPVRDLTEQDWQLFKRD